MATILSFLSGRQITDDNGDVVEDAELFHYQANTTNDLTVYSNQAGSTPYPQPVPCDAGGFVPLIYIGDSSDWKVVIKDGNGVELRTYDNLPKAVAEASAADFAPLLLEWTQVNSASSPVALTPADAGGAYEADTTAGNIEFDLPSAASVGDGKGFAFKKTSASNTLTIDPNASETIDDISASMSITAKDTTVYLVSNGAEWYTVVGYGRFDIFNNLVEDTAPDTSADFLLQFDTSAGIAKKVKPRFITASTVQATTSGTAFDFSSLPSGLKRIVVLVDSVSLSGADSLLLQIGDSGGIEATNYDAAGGANNGAAVGVTASTAGFVCQAGAAGRTVSGVWEIMRLTGNVWVSHHNFGDGTNTDVYQGGGRKELSGELDRVRLTRSGTDTFDSGQVNIFYE